jgi:uncharacterized protein (TIGR00297 family)
MLIVSANLLCTQSAAVAGKMHRDVHGWRRSNLEKARQTTVADLFALTSAAAVVAAFLLLRPPAPVRNLLPAAGITVAFTLMAWTARGVNWNGALAGAAIAFVLAAREISMFLVLLVVFALTMGATRIGSARKKELHTAEPFDGRSSSQVMANLGMAAAVVAFAPPGWQWLALAALAEVAADTCSSEIGMAFPGKTVLITTWKPVPPGMDGGISLRGTGAALLAAGAVALAGKLLGLVWAHQAVVVLYAGFLGSLADSVLGAVLERRGWLNNEWVNLLSTAAAAGIAWGFMG